MRIPAALIHSIMRALRMSGEVESGFAEKHMRQTRIYGDSGHIGSPSDPI